LASTIIIERDARKFESNFHNRFLGDNRFFGGKRLISQALYS
jgi:hypothetical protein